MKNSRNQNPLLFLTTLGVYLGLLVVGGAAPQVFAHSATTRNFELVDEIEVKDDLDTNPNDSDIYSESVIDVVRKLDALATIKKFDWTKKSEFSIEDFNFCESDGSRSFMGSGSISTEADKVITDRVASLAQQIFKLKTEIGAGEYFTGWPQGLTFEFSSANRELQIKVALVLRDADSASKLGQALSSMLEPAPRPSFTKSQQLVAENTKSKVDDVKVILVTHLARSDIDTLLAQDAK